MHFRDFAPWALIVSSTVVAQPATDPATAIPAAGDWSYSASTDGGEARFTDARAVPQLFVHCSRATRRVTISKLAAGQAAFLSIWTSSQQRTIASSFNPATGRLTGELAAADSLLDAMSSSRGRIAVSAGTEPSLVVPAWPEIARVVEDCRA